MKRTILTGVLILSLGLFVTSCKENKKSTEDVKIEKHEHGDSDEEMKKSEIAVAEYQCPMKCEGDKTYHEPGSCPVCKMDLKEVKKDTVE
jgi:hypothetical protein